MNLAMIANSVIVGVNPNQSATLYFNGGYTTTDDGMQEPSYTTKTANIQVQGLSTADLDHMDIATQQGEYNFVYINTGLLDAQIRSLGKGEDKLTFVPQGERESVEWRVLKVIERYMNVWTKVLVCRQ